MYCKDLAEEFKQYFEIVYAHNDELMAKVYKIRYDVYCAELHFEDEENCPNEEEKDDFDVYSHHFLLKHKPSGNYAGTVRFVIPPHDNPAALLPFEAFCGDVFDQSIIDPSALKRGSFGEVSRLAVPATFRKRAGEQGKPYVIDSPNPNVLYKGRRLFPYISVGLYLTCSALFVLKQLDYTFVMMEPRLARALGRNGIKFKQAGETIDYHGIRAPFYIDQKMLIENMRPDLMDLFEHIKARVHSEFSLYPESFRAAS